MSGENIDLYIIKLNKELTSKVFELAINFRKGDLVVDYDYLDRSIKAQMREANKFNARYVLFLGGDEYQSGKLNLKNMETGEQKLFELENYHEIINIIRD